MDSYNISTERGLTVYGCLRRVQLADAMLAMHFAVEDAEILEISSSIEIDLGGLEIDIALLSRMLRMILSWGSLEKQPQLIGI
ncbi:hypothetical protein SAMN05421505_1317 [Sinosporangium album]|uniref:Uncharacterized protein n=2 Tax=Sinosporangium album TaxID=504805 RepID=A0A1G8H7N9_9ACTN|nr:hypothetical protein SAMN05421505_1317 [Sinosporangium album]